MSLLAYIMHSKPVFALHCFAKVWQTAVPLGNVMVGLLVNLHAGQTLGGSVAWWCYMVCMVCMVVLLEAWGASETTSWAAGVDGQGKHLLIG